MFSPLCAAARHGLGQPIPVALTPGPGEAQGVLAFVVAQHLHDHLKRSITLVTGLPALRGLLRPHP